MNKQVLNNSITRVPVVSFDGKPLMPCTPGRAGKLIKSGKALPKRNKLGIFYIQLLYKTSEENTQDIVIGIDPGSNFTGIAIASKQTVNYGALLILPIYLKSKLILKGELRRERKRRRRLGHYKSNMCFGKQKVRNAHKYLKVNYKGNRRSGSSKIRPSIKQRKEFEFSVIEKLSKIFPINLIAYEHTKLNHNKTRGKNSFSVIEIGVNWLIEKLKRISNNITMYRGYNTKERRLLLGLSKTPNKSSYEPESHCTDAISLCSLKIKSIFQNCLKYQYQIIKRPSYSDRKYRLFDFSVRKNNKLDRWGGTSTRLYDKNKINIRKGDIVKYYNKKLYCCGEYLKNWFGKSFVQFQTTVKGHIKYPILKNVILVERSINMFVLDWKKA